MRITMGVVNEPDLPTWSSLLGTRPVGAVSALGDCAMLAQAVSFCCLFARSTPAVIM